MNTPRTLLAFCFFFLIGCGTQSVKQDSVTTQTDKPLNAGYLLMFTETREHQAEQSVRMIITDQYLRIDRGTEKSGFILFDRENKTLTEVKKNEILSVYVDSEAAGVKAINPDFPLHWVVESQPSQILMRTQTNDNTTATHYQFYLNDQSCYNLVTIDNHLTETLDAIRAYYQTRANQLKTNHQTNKDPQCSQAINLFNPSIRFQYGFPLREWSGFGYQRFLVDFRKDIIFPASLFSLPPKKQSNLSSH